MVDASLMRRGRLLRYSARLGKWPVPIILAVLYVLLELVSPLHEYKGLPFNAWDPGLGLMFGSMLLRPFATAIALFAGIVISEVFILGSSLDMPRVFAVAAIITTVYWAVAWQLRLSGLFDIALARLRDILVLLAAGLGGAVVSACLLTLLFIGTGDLAPGEMAAAGLVRFIGDALGIAVVTPLFLRAVTAWGAGMQLRSPRQLPDAICFIVVFAIFAWLELRTPAAPKLQFIYLLFIPVAMAAVRHGVTGAAIMLALAQTGLVGVLDWIAADIVKFTDYQVRMLALTGTGLIVGATVSERDGALASARAMEAEAARTARFNLVSGMAASLAHEINQPLTAARARARIVERLMEQNDYERSRQNIAQLISQIDRAADIMQRMRGFLRRGESVRRPASWISIADNAGALLAPLSAEKRVPIEWRAAENLPQILCDRVQIEQVLINLAGNAIEAIAGAGIAHGEVNVSAVAHAGGGIQVSVRDNGPGIDPDIAGRLFDAMVTTRRDGLGLGLAICATIIESHRGRLWLESSRPGHTEFRFHVPAATDGDPR